MSLMKDLSNITLTKLLLLVIAALVLIAPSSAFAAEEAVDHGDETMIEHLSEDAQAYEVDGLPQLDFTTYTPQIFWMIVLFLLMHLIMSKKALPEISSTIENRKNHIDSDLDVAKKLQDEAEAVQAAYEQKLQASHDSASQGVQDIENEIKQKAAEQLSAFQKKAEKEIAALEGRLETAKIEAMESMGDIASEVSAHAVEKIIGVKTDVKNAKSVVSNLNKKAA